MHVCNCTKSDNFTFAAARPGSSFVAMKYQLCSDILPLAFATASLVVYLRLVVPQPQLCLSFFLSFFLSSSSSSSFSCEYSLQNGRQIYLCEVDFAASELPIEIVEKVVTAKCTLALQLIIMLSTKNEMCTLQQLTDICCCNLKLRLRPPTIVLHLLPADCLLSAAKSLLSASTTGFFFTV